MVDRGETCDSPRDYYRRGSSARLLRLIGRGCVLVRRTRRPRERPPYLPADVALLNVKGGHGHDLDRPYRHFEIEYAFAALRTLHSFASDHDKERRHQEAEPRYPSAVAQSQSIGVHPSDPSFVSRECR